MMKYLYWITVFASLMGVLLAILAGIAYYTPPYRGLHPAIVIGLIVFFGVVGWYSATQADKLEE